MEIIGDSFASLYQQGRLHLLQEGAVIDPRGEETLEIHNATFVLTNPRSRLGYHKARKFSLPFAIGEAITLFSPVNKIAYLARINKRMSQFSDDGETTNGHYGARVAKHFLSVAGMLVQDPATRRAVIPIYSEHDVNLQSKDIPCTIGLNFLIREKKLHLFTTMRSNDFYWGFPYDLFMFTVLQEVMLNELNGRGMGLELGNYYHRATSLHVYQRHKNLLNTIETMEPVTFSLPYTLIEMQFLTSIFMHMEDIIPPVGLKDQFVMILRDWELRHRKMGQDEVPVWAEKFVH